MNPYQKWDGCCDRLVARKFPRFVAWGNAPWRLLALNRAEALALAALLICPWLIAAQTGWQLRGRTAEARDTARRAAKLTLENSALRQHWAPRGERKEGQ